jgi:hypothetical protein
VRAPRRQVTLAPWWHDECRVLRLVHVRTSMLAASVRGRLEAGTLRAGEQELLCTQAGTSSGHGISKGLRLELKSIKTRILACNEAVNIL